MRKVIAANWKMNKTVKEAVDFVTQLSKYTFKSDVVLCVPFTYLESVSKKNKFLTGAQNMFYEEKGAFTGEISPLMLKSLKVDYVLLGHSERRTLFYEDNELINKKVKAALKHGLKVILCVGENLDERSEGMEFEVVSQQLKECLVGIKSFKNIVIAYEPVWAIGTGKNAQLRDIEEMHAFIREQLKKPVRILYGGSVKPDNARDILSQKDVDGALVGSASLDVKSFVKIVKAAE